MSDEITADRLVTAYVRIRDAKAELTRKYEADKKKLEQQMEVIAGTLLGMLNAAKIDSARAGDFTFYKQEDVIPTGSDWNAFYDFVLEMGADGFEFLERRIKKTAVKDWMAQHKGTPPPGVSVLREYKVVVRKS